MAYLAAAAIRARIREVIDDGAGLIRTVTDGRLSGDYWTGSDDWAGGTRTLGTPVFDIPTMEFTKVAGSFEMGSFAIYRLDPIIIECEYDLGDPSATDEDRDAARATAEQDGDIIRQALEWPGNLTGTEAGTETGLADGVLSFVEFRVAREDWQARRLLTRSRYTALVRVVTATS